MRPDPDPTSAVPGMHIWGWMSEAELLWLGARAAEVGSVAEIGCLHGRSAFALLTACPGPVYCIDPWDDAADFSFGSFLGNCGGFPNCRPTRGRSPEAAADVPDVDMVFIDGSHDYAAVVADIDAWLPKARRLICGHDYFDGPEAGFPGVAEAVNAHFGKPVAVAPETSIWYVELT